MYVSHYKASSDTTSQSRRNSEATEIRQDADTLGPSAHIIYSGDFNLTGGSSEAAYTTLTGAGNGQAHDPTGATGWTNNSNTWKYLYSESTSSLGARFDFQLDSGAMFNQSGMQLMSDTSDPFTGSFPSSKYPYAYEVFGNNGTTALNGSTNTGGNTSLSDLANASTILGDLMQPYGSDHLPVVADYVLMLTGDFNRDGRVNAADILAMEQALTDLPDFQTAKGLSASQLLTIGDLNNDGQVNNADLQALLNLLISGGGSTDAVPEPSTFVLAVVALTMLWWRSRYCVGQAQRLLVPVAVPSTR